MTEHDIIYKIYNEFQTAFKEDKSIAETKKELISKFSDNHILDLKLYIANYEFSQTIREQELIRFVLNYISKILKVDKPINTKIFFD